MASRGVYLGLGVGWTIILVGAAVAYPHGVVRLGLPLDEGEGRILTQPNITFLLEDLSLKDGVLFAISAYFLSQDPLRVQVWRPESVVNRKYQLLWDARIVPPGRGVNVTYFGNVPGIRCPLVQQGDRIGLYAENGPMPVAYTFITHGSASTLRHPLGTRDPKVNRGQTVRFDALRYPYQYAVNAFVHTDLRAYAYDGRDDVKCPNISLEDVPPYEKPPIVEPPPVKNVNYGAQGPDDVPGPPGSTGVLYPNNLGVGQCGCFTADSLLHNHIMLAVFVWLTALTVVNICVICVYCCRSMKKATKHLTSAPIHQDHALWADQVREIVRELNRNGAMNGTMPPEYTGNGMLAAAMLASDDDAKSDVDYDTPLPEKY